MTIQELRQKRGEAIAKLRALQDKADAEKRSMSGEEDAEWQKHDKEQDELRGQIEAAEKAEERRSRLASLEDQATRGAGSGASTSAIRPTPGGGGDQARSFLGSDTYRSWVESYIKGESSFRDITALAEKRADTLQVGLFAKAGALVMPEQMVSGLLQSVDDETFMLQLCNVERLTTALSLGIISFDDDLDDADWTSELKTGNQDDLSFGKRGLQSHPIAKRVKVSNTLMRVASQGAASLVEKRMGYKFAVTFEKAGLTGDGNKKPLGVFTASDSGIPTSRDVVTGSATDYTADGLIEAKGTLKSAYWPGATWVLPRTGVTKIRKLKNAVSGEYIWMPGLSGGIPDRILDLPYKSSEFAPSTFTNGLYVGVLGNFKRGYTFALALDMTIQRLGELYAESNQTGFIGRMEGDGAPVLAEAFVRLKTGT